MSLSVLIFSTRGSYGFSYSRNIHIFVLLTINAPCPVYVCRCVVMSVTWWSCTPSVWRTSWMGWRRCVGPALWYPRTPSGPAPPAFPALPVFTSTETPTDARSARPTHTWQGATPTARTHVSPVGLEVLATRYRGLLWVRTGSQSLIRYLSFGTDSKTILFIPYFENVFFKFYFKVFKC